MRADRPSQGRRRARHAAPHEERAPAGGHIGVRLHCPRKARCAGTLNGVDYRIRPGKSATVRLRARRGTVVVTSREDGRKGAETVTARVRVR